MADRSLREWLAYLEGLHPREIDLGLARSATVAKALGLLPPAYRVITVAGTNGKGSVVYSSDAILQACDLKTGRYTSPHLLRYNERIAVNGRPVEDALIVAAFEAIEAARGATSLSYFEFATLAALWVFRHERVDVAILEVGLGGRLDAVNIVDSDVAVITAIDLDHQHWLGDTREAIAVEKAAIARRDRPVVLAERDYPSTLDESLTRIGSQPERAGGRWDWREYPEGIALRGAQDYGAARFPVPDGLRAANVAAALRAVECLIGELAASPRIVQSLGQLCVPARREQRRCLEREFVIDVAHNPAAMQALVEFLRSRPTQGSSYAMFGVMADKDIDAMTAILAGVVDGACALAIPGIDRAQSPELVWGALDAAGAAIPQSDFTVDAVLDRLLEHSSSGDRIVACGSFYSVALVLEALDRLEYAASPESGATARGDLLHA